MKRIAILLMSLLSGCATVDLEDPSTQKQYDAIRVEHVGFILAMWRGSSVKRVSSH